MRALLVALLVFYFIAFGLGSYVLLARLPSLYGLLRDFELVLAVFGLGLLLYLRRKEPGKYESQKHHWALLTYVAILFLNCFRSEPVASEVLLGAMQLSLVPFVAYGLGAILVRLPGGSRTLLWGLLFATALMAIPALVENGLGLVSMALWVDSRFEDTMTRATGFLANPIILAAVYQMSLIWALGMLIVVKERTPAYWALFAWCLLLLLVLYISYTRAGWLAFWVSTSLFWYFHKPRRRIIAIFGLFLLLIILLAPTGRVRLATMAEMRHRSNATRIDRWLRCAQFIYERPLIGHGLGRTCGVAPNQNRVKGSFFAHNYLLQLWVELGLVGLVPFLLFWYFFIRHVLQKGKSTLRLAGLTALAGFGAHSMVIGHIEYPPVAMMVALTMALVEGPLPDEDEELRSSISPFKLALPALLMMILLTALQIRVGLFQHGLQRVYELRKAGKIEKARSGLKELLAWDERCLVEEHDLARGWQKQLGP